MYLLTETRKDGMKSERTITDNHARSIVRSSQKDKNVYQIQRHGNNRVINFAHIENDPIVNPVTRIVLVHQPERERATLTGAPAEERVIYTATFLLPSERITGVAGQLDPRQYAVIEQESGKEICRFMDCGPADDYATALNYSGGEHGAGEPAAFEELVTVDEYAEYRRGGLGWVHVIDRGDDHYVVLYQGPYWGWLVGAAEQVAGLDPAAFNGISFSAVIADLGTVPCDLAAAAAMVGAAREVGLTVSGDLEDVDDSESGE